MKWFTGNVLRFTTSQGDYFVHENLLKAKCGDTGFKFVRSTRREQSSQYISCNEMTGFAHFLLWLNCNSMGPLGNDPEESYLDASCLAIRYGLVEFAEFVSSHFAKFAPAYYGGDDEGGKIHNPTLINVVYAHEQLENGPIRRFVIEQFVRSWIYRHAYSEMELNWLVDKHPELAKVLFQKVQDLVMRSAKKSLATFEWSPPGTNADAVDGDEVMDANENPGAQPAAEEPDPSGEEDHDDDSSQQSSDEQHTSSTEDFEVVNEEPHCEDARSEPAYPDEPVGCDPSAPDDGEALPAECFPVSESDPVGCDPYAPDDGEELPAECFPVSESDPVAETTEPVEESIWRFGVKPRKEKAESAWGWGVSEPTVEKVPEVVECSVEETQQPTVEDVLEPAIDVAEETFQRPADDGWLSFGIAPTKKKIRGGKKGKKATVP